MAKAYERGPEAWPWCLGVTHSSGCSEPASFDCAPTVAAASCAIKMYFFIVDICQTHSPLEARPGIWGILSALLLLLTLWLLAGWARLALGPSALSFLSFLPTWCWSLVKDFSSE